MALRPPPSGFRGVTSTHAGGKDLRSLAPERLASLCGTPWRWASSNSLAWTNVGSCFRKCRTAEGQGRQAHAAMACRGEACYKVAGTRLAPTASRLGVRSHYGRHGPRANARARDRIQPRWLLRSPGSGPGRQRVPTRNSLLAVMRAGCPRRTSPCTGRGSCRFWPSGNWRGHASVIFVTAWT